MTCAAIIPAAVALYRLHWNTATANRDLPIQGRVSSRGTHLYMLPRRVPPRPARSKLARTGLAPAPALGCLPTCLAASLMASFTSALWLDSDFRCRLSLHAGSSTTPGQENMMLFGGSRYCSRTFGTDAGYWSGAVASCSLRRISFARTGRVCPCSRCVSDGCQILT